MPAPEPVTFWIEEIEPGRYMAYYERHFWTGKAGNRARRAEVILGRYVRGTWRCAWCGDELHTDKRADARYCREHCRKAAARQRRADRAAWLRQTPCVALSTMQESPARWDSLRNP